VAPSSLTRRSSTTGCRAPGHRKNLLSGQFEEIRVALTKGRMEGGERWIAAQVFGRQSPPVGGGERTKDGMVAIAPAKTILFH